MSHWFDKIEQNEYTRRNQELAEQLRAMDFNPNNEAKEAELDWLRGLLESTPQTNQIFKFLVSGQMKQLMHGMAKSDDDRTKRAAKAVAECDKNIAASWRETSLKNEFDYAKPSRNMNPAGVGMAGPLGTWGDWPGATTSGVATPSGGGTKFNIPGRVNEVSQWTLKDIYKYEPWEGVGDAPVQGDYFPAAWLEKYVAENQLRPIGGQETLGGSQMATMQELQGWLKEGAPSTAKGYMNVMEMFPGHWQDLVQRSTKVMPKRKTQTTPWYAAVQA